MQNPLDDDDGDGFEDTDLEDPDEACEVCGLSMVNCDCEEDEDEDGDGDGNGDEDEDEDEDEDGGAYMRGR